MPNWCITDYTILGNKEQVEPLYEMLHELSKMEKPRVENGFGNLWLGCIVDYLGGDWHNIDCRGEVIHYYINDTGTELRMVVQIAWAESPSFRHFLEEKIPGITVYHYSEEPGMAGYWTNDPNPIDKYYLDSCHNDIDSGYFTTLEEAADYINGLNLKGIHVEPTFESISKAIDEFAEDEDEYVSFHEIEYIND